MEWAYIAGFFDGKGCIYKVKRKGKLLPSRLITISQASRPVLDAITDFLLDNAISCLAVREVNPNHYILDINGMKDVLPFLQNVYPFLIVKKEKAQEAITTLENYQKSGYMRKSINYAPEVLEMREYGFSYQAISKELGISSSTVERIVQGQPRTGKYGI